jgi:hypothetical protein
MDGESDTNEEMDCSKSDSIPESLTSGASVLVATAGDPTEFAVSLRLLGTQVTARDAAIVVTTTESAEQTIEQYKNRIPERDRPSLGIVDTTSQQSISALSSDSPIVFTPSPGDLERLVVGSSEISENIAPTAGVRHLVIRSLTPILDVVSADHLKTVLDRVVGIRSEAGISIFGIDYTAHDTETVTAIADRFDGVLWVTELSDTTLSFNYQSGQGRYS